MDMTFGASDCLRCQGLETPLPNDHQKNAQRLVETCFLQSWLLSSEAGRINKATRTKEQTSE
eukprot:709322-Amphidinium_carterae.1